jgi:hypothetical protein
MLGAVVAVGHGFILFERGLEAAFTRHRLGWATIAVVLTGAPPC